MMVGILSDFLPDKTKRRLSPPFAALSPFRLGLNI